MKGLHIALLSLVTIFVALVGMYFLLTVPVIDYNDDFSWTGPDRSVGGTISHADVVYIDYRPVISGKQESTNWWWGTKDGEWRRLEWHNMFNSHSGTQAVLRDSVSRFSYTGIERGSHNALTYQHSYDEVRHAYEQQSLFDRVWAWKVSDFH